MNQINQGVDSLIDKNLGQYAQPTKEIKNIIVDQFRKKPGVGPMSEKPNQPNPMSEKPGQPSPATEKPSFGKRLWGGIKTVGKLVAPSLLKIADGFTGGAATGIYNGVKSIFGRRKQ